MQRLTKISRMTMWQWKRNPEFAAWFGAAMQSEHDHNFELAVARHLRLAIKGQRPELRGGGAREKPGAEG